MLQWRVDRDFEGQAPDNFKGWVGRGLVSSGFS